MVVDVVCEPKGQVIKMKIQSDESGHIVVETIGIFVPFVLLVISILSLVSIVAVQARVHYALTQAANTLSMYSYTLEVIGVAKDLTALDNEAYKAASEISAVKNDINSVLSGLESFSDIGGAIESGSDAINHITAMGGEAAGDPKGTLQILMNYGINDLHSLAFEQLVRPLVGRYLENGAQSGDEYLERAGVMNKNTDATGLNALEFYQFRNLGTGNSLLIDRNGNVKLIVEYEVAYTFGGLPLPFKPTLKITQTAVTKAWLNGSGKGYW